MKFLELIALAEEALKSARKHYGNGNVLAAREDCEEAEIYAKRAYEAATKEESK
jgi:hypothetical protein